MKHSLYVLTALALLQQGCGGGGSGTGSNAGGGSGADSPIIKLSRVFPAVSFNTPVGLYQAPTDADHWYAIEQSGRVLRFDQAGNTAPSVVLDISGAIASGGETGLLGLAFHPDWPATPEVFLSFNRLISGNLQSVIARYTSPDAGATLDAGSVQVVLTIDQPDSNHKGGQISFGPDGLLYAGFGDGGGEGDQHGSIGNGQSRNTLLGKMLRIEVRGTGAGYSIPSDNPFSTDAQCEGGSGSAPCPEIWAFGFRNPWRWSFDRGSGDLWVADVGQSSWEEVDRVVKGGNFGWRLREGAHCYNPASGCPSAGTIEQGSALIDPVTEYGHDVGQAITGGYVYRGQKITAISGQYVFGDYSSGRIWTHTPGSTGLQKTERLHSSLKISSFAEGADGELYALDLSTGQVFQLQAAP